MILCGDGCIKCCDFCIYAKHELLFIDDQITTGGPIGCSLYADQRHQDIAKACGCCDDFHCLRTNNE